jgi:hypothetical protein
MDGKGIVLVVFDGETSRHRRDIEIPVARVRGGPGRGDRGDAAAGGDTRR